MFISIRVQPELSSTRRSEAVSAVFGLRRDPRVTCMSYLMSEGVMIYVYMRRFICSMFILGKEEIRLHILMNATQHLCTIQLQGYSSSHIQPNIHPHIIHLPQLHSLHSQLCCSSTHMINTISIEIRGDPVPFRHLYILP